MSNNLLDDEHLLRIGRKPAIRRKYGRWTMFGFACVVINQWISVVYTFQIGYENGGPAGLIYGFFVTWLGSLASFASLAELASMAPVSAGQYYWSAIVWPKSCSKLLSYVTGWMTVLGWQAAVASGTFAGALLIQTFIQIVNLGYVARLWHTTLIYYAVLLIALLANIFSGRPLTWIQIGAMMLYVAGFLAVMVPLVVLSPEHADAESVFTNFRNEGGWPTEGVSFMVGLAGVAFDFLGADCVYHMSEEVHNARVIVPWTMVVALCVGGFLGLLTTVGILFCIPGPEAVLSSSYEYPFATTFLRATGSRAGSAVMTMIITVLQVAAITGLLSSASRMLWSFARDGGIPASAIFSKVGDRSSIPRYAILLTTTLSVLVGLISLGSPLAFNDLLSLTISALYGSYLLACLGLLWRRVSGDIQPFRETHTDLVNIPCSGEKLAWGPWHIPGLLGTAINAFACVYLIVIFFFSFWPTATPVTPSTMNYSVLLFGAVAMLSTVYYLLRGRKSFQGPAVEIGVVNDIHQVKF